MKTTISKLLISAVAALFLIPVQATILYNVTDTGPTGSGCDSTHGHGLWTASDFNGTGGSCENFFSIDSMTLEIDDSAANSMDWTGLLSGTAINSNGIIASVELELSGYSEDHTAFSLKTGGSGAHVADWTFFSDMFGEIVFSSANKDGISEFEIEGIVGNYGFQMGDGANDKTATPDGASAWIRSPDSSGYTETNTYHWDLNLDLELVTEAPEPMTLALLGLGLLGLGVRRKQKV